MKYQSKLGNSYFHCFFSEPFGKILKGEYYWEVRIEENRVKCFSIYKELLKEFKCENNNLFRMY